MRITPSTASILVQTIDTSLEVHTVGGIGLDAGVSADVKEPTCIEWSNHDAVRMLGNLFNFASFQHVEQVRRQMLIAMMDVLREDLDCVEAMAHIKLKIMYYP